MSVYQCKALRIRVTDLVSWVLLLLVVLFRSLISSCDQNNWCVEKITFVISHGTNYFLELFYDQYRWWDENSERKMMVAVVGKRWPVRYFLFITQVYPLLYISLLDSASPSRLLVFCSLLFSHYLKMMNTLKMRNEESFSG